MFQEKLPSKRKVLSSLFEAWTPPLETEIIDLKDAYKRVLAKTQYSEVTLPVVRASMMDGVAVRSASFSNGIPDTSGWRIGVDFARADTGDDFPDAFDSVIRIEDVILDEKNRLSIAPSVEVKPGLNVRPRGSMVSEGELLMEGGLPIRTTDLAALAMGGKTKIPVYKKPRVAFIPTGSELVPIGQKPERGQNIDSNSLMVKHMLLELGADPILYPIVRDSKAELRTALYQALEHADIVLINGGSSKGGEDYNAGMLSEEGQVLCHWAAAGPGRPICVSLVQGKPAIVVPGPAISAYHVLEWFVTPLVCRFLNLPPRQNPRIRGRLTKPLHGAPFEFLTRMHVSIGQDGDYLITPLNFHGGQLLECLASNAQHLSKAGESEHPEGSQLEVELLRGTEFLHKG
ncbi:MAG: molybdopterin molybdotransferase MoeA [Oscillospiraceae bacterium]|nr:molybdopterin molybdotransferase MoeA [Oscillospiraceae bacterium]